MPSTFGKTERTLWARRRKARTDSSSSNQRQLAKARGRVNSALVDFAEEDGFGGGGQLGGGGEPGAGGGLIAPAPTAHDLLKGGGARGGVADLADELKGAAGIVVERGDEAGD